MKQKFNSRGRGTFVPWRVPVAVSGSENKPTQEHEGVKNLKSGRPKGGKLEI